MNSRNISMHSKPAIDSQRTFQTSCKHSLSGAPREQPSTRCIEGIGLTMVRQGRTLCEHLDFAIPAGTVSVLAPSDALCKTALLDLFAGKHRPTTGQCLIEGREPHDLPLELKQRVGILENAERPYEVMTIGQTALFFNGCYSEWRDETYNLLTNGLGVSRRVKISNLPNHQRALVALAVLLARNPDLLILDDWITTFGDQTRAIFHDAIRRFVAQSGKTILLVGHHVGLTPDLVEQLFLVGHSTSLALPISHLVSASHLAAEVRTKKTPRR